MTLSSPPPPPPQLPPTDPPPRPSWWTRTFAKSDDEDDEAFGAFIDWFWLFKACLLLGVAVAAGAGTWWYVQQRSVIDAGAVRRAAEDALADQEYAAALTYFQQLVDAGGQTDEILHRMALCQAGLGELETAHEMMSRLAAGGNLASHEWLARQLYAKPKRTKEEQRQLERHLNAVVRDDPQNLEAHKVLAELAVRSRDVEKAVGHLERLAVSSAQERLRLAKLYAMTRRADQAVPLGRDALAGFLEQLEEDPHDMTSRLKAMDAAVLLGDFPQAEQILIDGLKHQDDQKLLNTSLSHVYSLWAAHLARRRPGSQAEVLQLLQRSTHFDPVSPNTYPAFRDVMMRFPELRHQGRSQLLQALTRNNVAPAVIHMLLADVANLEQHPDEAQRHWLLAAQRDPTSVAPLNNLAVSLIGDDPRNAKVALLLIDRAIKINPNVAALRATRGRVLVKLKRWEAAQEDLTSVLPQMRDNAEVRLALAEVFTHTGFPELADEHLEAVLQQDPMQHLDAARILARGKDAQRARDMAAAAAEFYRLQSGQSPEDVSLKLALAEALALQHKRAEAIEVLEAAQTDPPDPRITRALVQHYLAWSRADDTRESGGDVKRLERLRQVLKHDPANRPTLMFLIGTARGQSPIAPAARKTLDEMLAVEQPSAHLLFLMGTREWLDGNHSVSRQWYERAYRADPNVRDLRNNLAWALVHSKPFDAKRALQLAEEAVARAPNQPNFRGTRAHALAQLGRWEEAKADLEYALRFDPDNADNLALQVQIYKQLGMGPPQRPQKEDQPSAEQRPGKSAP